MKKWPLIIITVLLMAVDGFAADIWFSDPSPYTPVYETTSPESGNVYYVRADGTVSFANRAQATDPTDANKSLGLAGVSTQTGFSAGDTIYFSDAGGEYSGYLSVGSSGTSGSKIYYLAVAGDSPIFNVTTGTNALYVNAKSYVVVSGLSFEVTSADAGVKGLYIKGITTNVEIGNLTIDLTGSAAATKYVVTADGAYSNVFLHHITSVGASASGWYFYGAGASNLILDNISNTGGNPGFNINNVAGLTIYDSQQTGAVSQGIYIRSGVSGVVKIIDTIITSSAGAGLQISGSTNDPSSYISGCSISGSGTTANYLLDDVTGWTIANSTSGESDVTGFQVSNGSTEILFYYDISEYAGAYGYNVSEGCSNIAYRGCTATLGDEDGFSIIDSTTISHDITYSGSTSSYNGNKVTISAGDGWTCHDANYNINLFFCISHHNTASGVAMVGTSSGKIINSVIYGNGGNWTGDGGVDQVRGGMYFAVTGDNATTSTSWTVQNSIVADNYPVDLFLTAGNKDIIDRDFNCYDSSDVDSMATIDGLSTVISWTTYHGTYETNSVYGDPKFKNSIGDYRIKKSSLCYRTGDDPFANGDGDQYDMAGLLVWDDDTDTAVGEWLKGVSIGAYSKAVSGCPLQFYIR